MDNDLLKIAIDLIRAGQKQQGREILQSILKADVHNIPAWFWYVETCSTLEERLQILQTCAQYNPENSQVKLFLDALSQQQTQASLRAEEKTKPPEVVPRTVDNGISSPVMPQVAQKPVAVEQNYQETPKTQKPVRNPMSKGAVVMWAMAGILIIGFALLIFYAINSVPAGPADPASHHFTQPIEYYLYVPKAYTADRAWPLFIGIHGSGGTGLDCWNLWQPYAEKEGFILLCPTLPENSSGALYLNQGEEYTWAAISQVTSQYNILPRYFLVGFSGGAFFVQGFCLDYPRSVQAVTVLSSGYFFSPSQMPRGIPFLVVIGNLDNPDSINGSEQFAQGLANSGHEVSYWLLPWVGHTVTNRTQQLTIDFYNSLNK